MTEPQPLRLADPAPGSHGPGRPPGGQAKQTPLEQMGGTAGLVYMMLPVVAFVLANASYGLTALAAHFDDAVPGLRKALRDSYLSSRAVEGGWGT